MIRVITEYNNTPSATNGVVSKRELYNQLKELGVIEEGDKMSNYTYQDLKEKLTELRAS